MRPIPPNRGAQTAFPPVQILPTSLSITFSVRTPREPFTSTTSPSRISLREHLARGIRVFGKLSHRQTLRLRAATSSSASPRTPINLVDSLAAIVSPVWRWIACASSPSSSISPATTIFRFAPVAPSTSVCTIEINAVGFELYESLMTVNPSCEMQYLATLRRRRDRSSSDAAISSTVIPKACPTAAAASAFEMLCRPFSGNSTAAAPRRRRQT